MILQAVQLKISLKQNNALFFRLKEGEDALPEDLPQEEMVKWVSEKTKYVNWISEKRILNFVYELHEVLELTG